MLIFLGYFVTFAVGGAFGVLALGLFAGSGNSYDDGYAKGYEKAMEIRRSVKKPWK